MRLLLLALAVAPAWPLSVFPDAFAVETFREGPPGELAERVRKELASEGLRVLRDQKPFVDLWFRSVVPTGPARSGPGIFYGILQTAGLLGAARFHTSSVDFRAQSFPAGVYTLRYALQPEDGDHQGVTDSRDFLLLVPAVADASPEVLEPKTLVRLSARLHDNKHPGVLALVESRPGSALPGIVRDEAARRVVLQAEAAAPEEKPLRLSIVLVGKAAP